MRFALPLAVLVALVPSIAVAQTTPEPGAPPLADTEAPRPRRARRDRFTNTFSVGGTVGVGSPLGAVGVFAEYRPVRWVSASAGGGLGGTFGPAVGGSLYLDPLVGRWWALGVGGAYSHNFSYMRGIVIEGRPGLPEGTDWASVEVQAQLRPDRGWFIRLGVGYAFLLNTAAFRIGTETELNQAMIPSLPVLSPVDAVRAAARDETLGTFYVHLDVAPVWRL